MEQEMDLGSIVWDKRTMQYAIVVAGAQNAGYITVQFRGTNTTIVVRARDLLLTNH